MQLDDSKVMRKVLDISWMTANDRWSYVDSLALHKRSSVADSLDDPSFGLGCLEDCKKHEKHTKDFHSDHLEQLN